MTDVWRCCSCSGANLIANADVKCPVCSHLRCVGCHTGPPTLSDNTPTSDTLPAYLTLPSIYKAVPRNSHLSKTTGYSFPNGAEQGTSGFLTTHVFPAGFNYTYASHFPPGNTHRATDSSQSGAGTVPSTHGRPSMAAWWTCHDCLQTNNPSLAPDRCSYCGHYKCGSCTTYTR